MGTNWSAMRNVILEKRKADEALMKTDYLAYLKGLVSPSHQPQQSFRKNQ